MMKKTLLIQVWDKIINLFYQPDPNEAWAIIVDCEAAGIHQGMLLEDFWEFLEDIPLLVQKREKDLINNVTVEFSPEETEKLSHLSFEKCFSNISSYIRSQILTAN